MLKENLIMGGIGIAVTAIGGLYLRHKLKKVDEQVNESKKMIQDAINDLSKNISVDVPSTFIESAIDKAVDREVGRQISYIARDAVYDIKDSMKKDIKSNVDQAFGDTKILVKAELEKQIKNLSIESIKKEVLEEAKKTAADRFKSDLDDILNKHNQELDRVTEIYSSIAKSMRGDK